MTASLVTRTFSPEDIHNARRFHNENNDTPLWRGKTAMSVMQAWIDAGSPEVAVPDDTVATVFHRPLDKLGRVNHARRTVEAPVLRSQLNTVMQGRTGRPRTEEYVQALGLTPDTTRVLRVVTANGAIHSVRFDIEEQKFVYSWDSKSDQKEVIVWLLRTLDAYRTVAIDSGGDVSEIDAAMETHGDTE